MRRMRIARRGALILAGLLAVAPAAAIEGRYAVEGSNPGRSDVTYRGLAAIRKSGDTYSIADMAAYPWIVPWEKQGQTLDDHPHLKRWFEAIAALPATQAAYARAPEVNPDHGKTMSEEAKKVMFGQTASNTKR